MFWNGDVIALLVLNLYVAVAIFHQLYGSSPANVDRSKSAKSHSGAICTLLQIVYKYRIFMTLLMRIMMMTRITYYHQHRRMINRYERCL